MPAPTIPLTERSQSGLTNRSLERARARRRFAIGRECSMVIMKNSACQAKPSASPSTPSCAQYHGLKQQGTNTL